MASADVLAQLAALDIRLTAEAGHLVIDAPAGAMTPALREQIAAAKPALLAALAGTESHEDGPGAPPAARSPRDAGMRTAPPYPCGRLDCDATAAGPWQRVGPDAWQAECGAGHRMQRTEYSFEHPPPARGRPLPSAATALRYPVTVRWASERGWLLVRDPFTGEWHEVHAKDAPRCWLDALRGRKGQTPC